MTAPVLAVGEYWRNPKTETVHITWAGQTLTLCGLQVQAQGYRQGDETSSGIAATCATCTRLFRKTSRATGSVSAEPPMTSGEEYLGRRLSLPQAHAFSDLLEYRGEWTREGNHLPSAWIGENAIGPYCSVDLSQIGRGYRWRGIVVHPTDLVMDALIERIVTSDDHLSFKIIAHEATGKALVILEHGHIIGSHWLAYIEPSSVPERPAQ